MDRSLKSPHFHKIGLIAALQLSLVACEATLSSDPGGKGGNEGTPLGPDGQPLPGGGDGDGTPGGDGDGVISGDGDQGQVFAPFAPQAGQLRRLTRTQFRNAVDDLLGVEIDTDELEADSFSGDFAAVGAATVVTSSLGAEGFLSTVESAVGEVFADEARWTTVLGCTPTAGDDSCFRSFLQTTGTRAWRRPLSQEEMDGLAQVAATAETELGSAMEGTRWGTVALLSSMNFVYRPELGTATDGGLRISGYEMASRLAFLIWNSLPDERLLGEAASGLLDTKDGVVAAAQWMLETPRGRESIAAFAEDYMRLDRISGQAKDPSVYPEYSAALQEAMQQDMREVWAQVAFDEDASALELFSTRRVFANAELASLYGLDPSGLDSETFATMDLPEDSPRAGILSKAGFLSQYANQIEGSPTLRGKFMREAMMCQHVTPPPGNVALELPEPSPDAPTTKRDRLEMHRTEPVCANCHEMMDPLGLPLEQFDAIGRFRTTELGLTIDPTGNFDGTPVADSKELGSVLSSSETVADCLVEKFYSYAVARAPLPTDRGVVHELAGTFETSGYRMRELILEVVGNDAFAAVTAQL